MGVQGTVSCSAMRITLSIFHILLLVAATVDLMVSRIGPKWSISISNVPFGSIRDKPCLRPQTPNLLFEEIAHLHHKSTYGKMHQKCANKTRQL